MDDDYELVNDADVAPPQRSVIHDYVKRMMPSVARSLAKGLAVHTFVYCGTALAPHCSTVAAVVIVIKKVYDIGLL